MDINNSTQAATAAPTKNKYNFRIGLRCNSKQDFSDLLTTIKRQDSNQSIQALSQIISATQKAGGAA